MSELRELLITRVGAQGDGVADVGGAPVFVPFTLASESVMAEVSGERGRLIELLQPSASRIKPICRHFGVCGGCSVQHMARRVLSCVEAGTGHCRFSCPRPRRRHCPVARARRKAPPRGVRSGTIRKRCGNRISRSSVACARRDRRVPRAGAENRCGSSGARSIDRAAPFKARRGALDGDADEVRSRRAA